MISSQDKILQKNRVYDLFSYNVYVGKLYQNCSVIIQSFFLSPDREHTTRLTEFYGIVHNIQSGSCQDIPDFQSEQCDCMYHYNQFSRTSLSLFISSGFAICPFMPVFLASCTSSAKALAVIATIGSFPCSPGRLLIAAVAS